MRDVAAVANVTAAVGVPLKVILETCLLTKEEIAAVSSACRALGVEWIKTSTGFSTGGATVEDVALMHSKGTSPTVALPVSRVKASGGIRTLNDALGVIKAGKSAVLRGQTFFIKRVSRCLSHWSICWSQHFDHARVGASARNLSNHCDSHAGRGRSRDAESPREILIDESSLYAQCIYCDNCIHGIILPASSRRTCIAPTLMTMTALASSQQTHTVCGCIPQALAIAAEASSFALKNGASCCAQKNEIVMTRFRLGLGEPTNKFEWFLQSGKACHHSCTNICCPAMHGFSGECLILQHGGSFLQIPETDAMI